ncbi:MAG TPA: amidohydrolase family protein [Thermoanaerobaculia bacterium]|nr:amidohydrolase family protein [Thermoanaerobaculia bacterium]
MKVMGAPNWGVSVETLRLVDEARARGVDVTMDQYPYTASSTSLQAALIPQWALGHYVRDRKLLTLEEAVRKMTSFPAARVGLHDRGILRPGMKADLVLFDPSAIADKATFESPHQRRYE